MIDMTAAHYCNRKSPGSFRFDSIRSVGGGRALCCTPLHKGHRRQSPTQRTAHQRQPVPPSPDIEMSADYPTTGYSLRILTLYYLLLATGYWLLATGYLLLTTYYLLLTTYYVLLTTCYILHTTYYLLPTAYYLLLTAYYLLPITYY